MVFCRILSIVSLPEISSLFSGAAEGVLVPLPPRDRRLLPRLQEVAHDRPGTQQASAQEASNII